MTAPPLDARPAGDHLLAAVCAAPLDDAPRLILADWLDEHGEPDYAAFIRVQIELLSHPSPCLKGGLNPGHPRDCRACWLRRRERQLLTANFGAWTDSLPESMVTKQCPHCAEQAPDYETNVVECRQCDCTGLVPDHDNVEFSRGFISSVSLTCGAFVGGSCRHCEGRGSLLGAGPDRGNPTCPACSGTGRTPGLAAALARLPVVSVTLSDRKPLGAQATLGASSNADSIWYVGPDLIQPSGNVIRNAHHLPPEIGRLLTGWAPVTRRVVGGEMFSLEHCRGYPSADAAKAALGLAALAHLQGPARGGA